MHLGELELGLCADTLREGSVADYVAERLSFRLILFENLALGMITDDAGVDKAANIQTLGSKL